MHLLSTRPGGHVEDDGRGVVRVAQTPGEIVVLSAADTTLSLLADTVDSLPADHPSVRLANLMWFRQPASIDMYVDDVLQHARVVVIDHLGSCQRLGLSGGARDAARARARPVAGDVLRRFRRRPATADAQHRAARRLPPALAQPARRRARQRARLLPADRPCGLRKRPAAGTGGGAAARPRYQPQDSSRLAWQPGAPVALLVFYRAHLQAGNTAVFDAMLNALAEAGVNGLALAVDSLKNPTSHAMLQALAAEHRVAIVLNATSFSLASLDSSEQAEPLAGNAPVLQLITAGCSQEQWQDDPHGLAPRDLAMQVVLPEVDGRIGTRAISFKGLAWRCDRAEVDVVRYQPEPERMAYVAELARRWCRLREKPNADKRIALILANYPNDDARLANGVGLDTPASTVVILQALQDSGYTTGTLPEDGDALIAQLVQGVTNDLDANDARPAGQSLALADYLSDFNRLPPESREAVNTLWGDPERDPMLRSGRFMVPGMRLGHVFVGIQPARGRDLDLVATYHDADLVPPHNYLAFYFWLRRRFSADAVVHVGKHGNLEWLPGKSVALGAACWPDALLGPLPHLYPFIVNDPGEGSQAKRRTQAVIIDHLMPALTRAETYGPLQKLERQMDEYYEALSLDPRRARRLRGDILECVLQENLHQELGFTKPADDAERESLLTRLDAYLCEIKESQIRDGLHTLGRSPQGRQRVDTLVALARFPGGTGAGQGSLLRALSQTCSSKEWMASTPSAPSGPPPGAGRAPRCCSSWATSPGAMPATRANGWRSWRRSS
jgi:cobaltochelatase CobN